MVSGTGNLTIEFYTLEQKLLLANRNPHCKAPKVQLEMNFRCFGFYSLLLIALLNEKRKYTHYTVRIFYAKYGIIR